MIYRIWRYFPCIGMKSRADKELQALGITPGRYMGMAVLLSSAISLLALVSSGVISALFAFACAFGALLLFPVIEMRKRANEIESEMPFFLRSLGLLLEIGIPFESAVVIAGKGHGRLRTEMQEVISSVKKGMPLQKALSSFAQRYASLEIKRAVSQVISAYEIGSRGTEIKRIGDELLSMQKHRLREYSAKSAMIGLLLIISAAILPTFFLVYAVAGRFALGTRISNEQTAFVMLVLFPLISISILLLSKSIMPRSIFHGRRDFDLSIFAPGSVFVLGFLLLPGLQILSLAAGSAAAGYIIYRSYRSERRAEDIESRLPDALFSVSGMPRSAKAEDIFRIMEKGGYGALSEEAAKSARQISMNVGIGGVIEDFWERNDSMMLKRACLMLEQMINTSSLDRLGMLAEDMIAAFQIKREQAQLFSLQKYTLIFGGFLIPLILKVTIHLLEEMGGLMDETSVADAVGFASSIVPPYLMVYSAIASIAISEAEGKRSSAAIYLVLLSAASLATFYFISF